MKDHAGLRARSDDAAIPGKRQSGIFIKRRDAHTLGEGNGLGAAGVEIGFEAWTEYLGRGDAPENRARISMVRGMVRETGIKDVEDLRQRGGV